MSAGWVVSKSCGQATCCASKKTLRQKPPRRKPQLKPGHAEKGLTDNTAQTRERKSMTATQTQHKVVSGDEWRKARLAHLAAEKEFTRQRDELSRRRRELPWER